MSELLPEEIPDEPLLESDASSDDGEVVASSETESHRVESSADGPVDPANAVDEADRLVPVWLAGTVLALLLAVMALGGFALHGVLNDPPSLA
ncbi:MAG: hypothetical protein CVT60_06600, partial [Actinobacteria bacterium HGW-Actinobacteria-10]